MNLGRQVAATFRSIPDVIEQRADRLRVRAYGYQEQARAEGWPAGYVEQQGRQGLARADFLDALAASLRPRRAR